MAEFEYKFEWDPQKAASNLAKHKVSFENAATVFQDAAVLSLFDGKHSQVEERWITLGLDNRGQLMVVCHTWRETEAGESNCRIISARKASRRETAQYFNRKA
jgi:uncharacterized protein